VCLFNTSKCEKSTTNHLASQSTRSTPLTHSLAPNSNGGRTSGAQNGQAANTISLLQQCPNFDLAAHLQQQAQELLAIERESARKSLAQSVKVSTSAVFFPYFASFFPFLRKNLHYPSFSSISLRLFSIISLS